MLVLRDLNQRGTHYVFFDETARTVSFSRDAVRSFRTQGLLSLGFGVVMYA